MDPPARLPATVPLDQPPTLNRPTRSQLLAINVELFNLFLEGPAMNQPEVEVIDSTELAKRLNVPESWVRSWTNAKRTSDPIPHFRLGRYVRFPWGSTELSRVAEPPVGQCERAGSLRRINDQIRSLSRWMFVCRSCSLVRKVSRPGTTGKWI